MNQIPWSNVEGRIKSERIDVIRKSALQNRADTWDGVQWYQSTYSMMAVFILVGSHEYLHTTVSTSLNLVGIAGIAKNVNTHDHDIKEHWAGIREARSALFR
jgi:predicted RNA-binding protein with PUA-like domain